MNSLFINQTSYIDPDVYKIGVVILLIIMAMALILIVLKSILEYKLKHKMLHQGISEKVAASILQKDPNSVVNTSIKWFLVFLGLSVGLFILDYTRPLGVHSFGIMALSISISFLFHYLYLRRFSK